MLVYVIRRAGQSILVVLAMAVLVFVGVYAIGNPIDIMISPDADQAEMAAAIRRLGLDKPLYEQFWIFLKNALHGDLGTSFVFSRPAAEVILERMPATLELAALALILSVAIGIPLGVTRELFGVAVSFLTLDGLAHMLLPATNLALYKMSLVIRLARAGTREVVLQDYVKFARAKGLSQRRIVRVHVLKNIMIPVVTVIGLELGNMIAFAVVTETVFAWPGMGKLLIDSIGLLDRPVIVAYLMLTVLMFIIINFTVDILYSLLDPRVRLVEAKA